MSNCELAIWNCCESASKFIVNSLVSASIDKGAKTVIGWTPLIYSPYSIYYMDSLFNYLESGYSVSQSSTRALSDRDYTSSEEARTILDGLVIAGNKDNIIFPVNKNEYEIHSFNLSSFQLFDISEYNYAETYQEGNVKFYAKTVGNIITDDFIINYYEGGKLFKQYKSSYSLSGEDRNSMRKMIQSLNLSEEKTENLFFTNISGKIQLVEKISNFETGKVEYVEYFKRNVIEKEILNGERKL